MRRTGRVALACGAVALVLAGAGVAEAMSGGTPVADPAEAPWVATLATRIDAPLLQRAGCGGVLIAPDRVLTAGHCVDHVDPSQTEVHIGARVLSSDPGEVRAVRGISRLPGYALLPSPVDPTDPNLDSARNDLAIVLLDRPVTGVSPLRIAGHRPAAGTAVALYAHGTTGQAGAEKWRDDVLHRGDLTVLDQSGCAAATPAVVDAASVLCARDGHGGTVTGCYLDSGSPLVRYTGDGPELVGVFSFGGETAGKTCGQASPAYFADATAFRRWAGEPYPFLQPYPATPARVAGTPTAGATVQCVPPTWDPLRGRPPVTVGYQWATITHAGPFSIPVPIDGATGTRFTPGTGLAGTEIACQVTAGNPGGTTTATSAAVTVR